MVIEYDREAAEQEMPWIRDDAPHMVVITGTEKTKRYANVIGPFENKKKATLYAAKQRREIKKVLAEGYPDHGWTIHVRHITPPD